MENYTVSQFDGDEAINISGVITEKTWNQVYAKTSEFIKSQSENAININLAGITKADSSALSLLMQLQREHKNKTINVQNLPESLKQLALLYNI